MLIIRKFLIKTEALKKISIRLVTIFFELKRNLTMRIIKKLLVTILLSFSTLYACGWGSAYSDYSKENFYNFLEAKFVGVAEDNPLYALTSSGRVRTYEDRKAYFQKIKRQLNIAEWHDYLQGKLSQKELEELLYGAKGTLMQRYQKYASKLDNKAFENYLGAIGHVTEVEIMHEKDAFLKLRYLYLNMREAHYAAKYETSLALYAKHYKAVKNVKSIVHEWIDALRAGAMQHLGLTTESNLLYAKVLEHKSNAYLGYYDFNVKNDKAWQELLASAKTKDEKAKLYFLRALKWEGSPLHEHQALAKLAPKSKWFERLTYMIMQDFQESAYRYESSENKEGKYIQKERRIYLLKTQEFLKTLTSLKEPSFFSLYSQVYLTFLRDGQIDNTAISRLERLATQKQQPFVEILKYLEQAREVKAENREKLFKNLEQLSKKLPAKFTDALFRYTALNVAPLYEEMSAKRIYAKIFADTSNLTAYLLSLDAITAQSYEAYVEEKNRNYFEEQLFRKSMKTLPKNGVAQTLAVLSIKDGDFQKAQKYLNQVPKFNRSTRFNPFNVSLSGNNRKIKGKGYDQRKFVETMLKIEESLKTNPNSAMDYFLFATGRYNSSWYGNFPTVGSIWHSTAGYDKEEAKHILKNAKEIEALYEKALKNATKEEFKAKIAYQLLKVKMNQEIFIPALGSLSVAFGQENWRGESLRKQVHESAVLQKAFEKYKADYADTKYGKEMIGSCVTFSYF